MKTLRLVPCTLEDPQVRLVLDRLFAEKGRQSLRVAYHVASSVGTKVLRRRPTLSDEVERLRGFHACVSRKQGHFLYLVARSLRANRIVEYGTSVGVSTIFLAAAVRDNGGGHVIGSELDSCKLAAARRNLDEAGLATLVEVREGDALQTLRDPGGSVDLVFLDGFPEFYLPIVKMLMPRLRNGAVVLADNIFTHRNVLAPYRSFVRDSANGFHSMTLLLKYGTEYSVRL